MQTLCCCSVINKEKISCIDFTLWSRTVAGKALDGHQSKFPWHCFEQQPGFRCSTLSERVFWNEIPSKNMFNTINLYFNQGFIYLIILFMFFSPNKYSAINYIIGERRRKTILINVVAVLFYDAKHPWIIWLSLSRWHVTKGCLKMFWG